MTSHSNIITYAQQKSPPYGGPFLRAVRQSQYYIEELINFEITLMF